MLLGSFQSEVDISRDTDEVAKEVQVICSSNASYVVYTVACIDNLWMFCNILWKKNQKFIK